MPNIRARASHTKIRIQEFLQASTVKVYKPHVPRVLKHDPWRLTLMRYTPLDNFCARIHFNSNSISFQLS